MHQKKLRFRAIKSFNSQKNKIILSAAALIVALYPVTAKANTVVISDFDLIVNKNIAAMEQAPNNNDNNDDLALTTGTQNNFLLSHPLSFEDVLKSQGYQIISEEYYPKEEDDDIIDTAMVFGLKTAHTSLEDNFDEAAEPADMSEVFDRSLFSCVTTGYSKEFLYGNIPYELNAEVEKFVKYFTSPRGRVFFTRWLERSTAFKPLITEELRKEGLPEDLIYLAMIESGFNARAYSRARAVGVWQFMKSTGRMFGLKNDYWIDERRDPVKSTQAAVKFLKLLYTRYDSWYLSMAAYNAGEGKVNRAIRRYKTKDFWKLTTRKRRYLKKETKQYVPKFLAARLIAENPEAYGFTDLNYHEPIEFDTVKIDFATDLRLIAAEAGVSTTDIKKLNPELKNWFTPPNKGEYFVKVPIGTGEIVQAKINDIPKSDRLKLHVHKIRRGETLSHIADKYKTSIRAIKYLNNLSRSSFIREGKTLIIPVRAKKISSAYSPVVTNTTYKKKSLPKSGLYTVRRGDTLWSISRKFGLTLNEVLKINNLTKKHVIKPGQRIKLKRAFAPTDKKES